MDDFTVSNLHSSRDEWCARLVNILTPLIIEGLKSIFNEAWKMSVENDEASKYLMTFQNLLCRVPKWNAEIIEDERKRIIERSGCGYLEDLITCVHVIQLKTLTCIRVGNKQKKIDISIPKLDAFLHKAYIHSARKSYTNVYLFEKNVNPLMLQKHNRELELIVQECILAAIRESIPTEAIIRAYLDESVEQEEEVVIEPIKEEVPITSAAQGTGASQTQGAGVNAVGTGLAKLPTLNVGLTGSNGGTAGGTGGTATTAGFCGGGGGGAGTNNSFVNQNGGQGYGGGGGGGGNGNAVTGGVGGAGAANSGGGGGGGGNSQSGTGGNGGNGGSGTVIVLWS